MTTSQGTATGTAARFVVYALILFSSFSFDLFWLGDGLRSNHLGYDSRLVLSRLQTGAEGAPWWHPNVVLINLHRVPYTSQVGLQGIVLSAVQQGFHSEPRQFGFRAALAFSLLTAALLAVFFTSLSQRLGSVAGAAAVLLTALSPIFLEFATSLYWSLFLLLAPFVIVWMLYPRWSQTWAGCGLLSAAVFAAVVLKCLCGYEFVTSVVLSPLAAVVYHHTAARSWSWRGLAMTCTLLAVGTLGCLGAMGLHALQLHSLLGGDGVQHIVNVAQRQTTSEGTAVLFQFPQSWFARLPSGIGYPLDCFFNFFTKPAFSVPRTFISESFPVSLKLMSLFGGAFCFGVWRGRKRLSREMLGLAAAVAVSFFTSLSWQVLAKNHMCVHLHLNQIVFFLPFMLLVYASLGLALQRVADRYGFSQPLAAAGLPLALLLAAGAITAFLDQRSQERVRHYEGKLAAVPRVREFLSQPRPDDGSVRGSVDGVNWYGVFSNEMDRSLLALSGPTQSLGCLVYGWAFDAEDPRSQRVFVVMQGSRLCACLQPEFFARPDVEQVLQLKAPQAGFRFWAPIDATAAEPLRVFVVTGADWSKVHELPVPAPAASGQ